MSQRDKILNADDIAEETVDVPEWDTKILLRAMNGQQQVRYAETVRGDSQGFMYADILMVTAYDPATRELIFDPADREALSLKSGGVLNRLGMKVLTLSGTDVEAAVEELEENPT